MSSKISFPKEKPRAYKFSPQQADVNIKTHVIPVPRLNLWKSRSCSRYLRKDQRYNYFSIAKTKILFIFIFIYLCMPYFSPKTVFWGRQDVLPVQKRVVRKFSHASNCTAVSRWT